MTSIGSPVEVFLCLKLIGVDMNLLLQRYRNGSDSTLGSFSIDGEFVCFTCEDQYQEVKIRNETRIPAGRYEIKMRVEGGSFNPRYADRFQFHKGMLWLQDVPGFTWIYIHVGNSSEDTSGCILLGYAATRTGRGGFVSQSVLAYEEVYPVIAKALGLGERVFITVRD